MFQFCNNRRHKFTILKNCLACKGILAITKHVTFFTAPELDPTYAANITEDSQSPAQVKELAATDKDKVAKGTGLTYSITGGNDAGYFVVDGASIKVAAGIPNTALDIDGQAGDKTFTLDVM